MMKPSMLMVPLLLVTSGCATRPREFDAQLAAAPADDRAYLRDFATCRLLARSNFRNNTGQQTAVVGSGFLTFGFVGPFAGIAMAKAIKSGREARLNEQMTGCLEKYGYTVTGWERAGKKKAQQPAQLVQAQPVQPTAEVVQ